MAIILRSGTKRLSENRKPIKKQKSGSLFLIGPYFDSIFIIGAPIISLLIGVFVANPPLNHEDAAFGYEQSWVDFFLGIFVFAHLVIVIFRSHLNQEIFNQFPLRFSLVPLLLFIAMGTSTKLLILCTAVAVFWDIYHSSMQTFGISRIYDIRAGNYENIGRRLDIVLNLLLYIGPIAAGCTLVDHLEELHNLEQIGIVLFTRTPTISESNTDLIGWLLLCMAIPFLIIYIFVFRYYTRRGLYRFCSQKTTLLISTALCSVYAWGFNPFGMAFFIMNFFHALQYFAIIWWAENTNIAKFIGCRDKSWRNVATLTLILFVGFSFGFFAESIDETSGDWLFSLLLVVSLMHFWYDGFIWSVSRKQN